MSPFFWPKSEHDGTDHIEFLNELLCFKCLEQCLAHSARQVLFLVKMSVLGSSWTDKYIKMLAISPDPLKGFLLTSLIHSSGEKVTSIFSIGLLIVKNGKQSNSVRSGLAT